MTHSTTIFLKEVKATNRKKYTLIVAILLAGAITVGIVYAGLFVFNIDFSPTVYREAGVKIMVQGQEVFPGIPATVDIGDLNWGSNDVIVTIENLGGTVLTVNAIDITFPEPSPYGSSYTPPTPFTIPVTGTQDVELTITVPDGTPNGTVVTFNVTIDIN